LLAQLLMLLLLTLKIVMALERHWEQALLPVA
jgi:hypothetical protein